MDRETATNALKDAIIAEVASDVLHMRSDIAELKPLIQQLKDSLPQHFDLLKAGMIETLEIVNKDIADAGGERIEFVKGQLHAFIEQAVGRALEQSNDKIAVLQTKFEKQHIAATQNLKAQYEEVSLGMQNVLASSNRRQKSLSTYILVSLTIITLITASSAICWQLASYKEAIYMAYANQVNSQKSDTHLQTPRKKP